MSNIPIYKLDHDLIPKDLTTSLNKRYLKTIGIATFLTMLAYDFSFKLAPPRRRKMIFIPFWIAYSLYNLYYYFNTELKNELVLRGIDITSLIRKEYINDYKKKETL